MNQTRIYDKGRHSDHVRHEGKLNLAPQVRCSACRYAVRFRAYPEVIDCTQLHKMQNADTFRDCSAFEAA